MAGRSWRNWFQRTITGNLSRKHRRLRSARRLTHEMLIERITPAVNAFFLPGVGGVLTIIGDNQNNTIEVSRNAGGQILVNGGAVVISGGTPTVANTTLITAFGLGGSDTITLNESNGVLPRANLFGGTGNDVLTGGSGADLIFGQAGDDTLLGRGAIDMLFGGTDNDVLIGGDADDQVFGESGNDRLVWNPGDDTDLNEGGAGSDTIEVNGGNGAEKFTVTANGARVRFDRIDPAPFSLDIGTSEDLVVNMNGGNDEFAATGNLAALIKITVDGGIGSDTILGSNGADLLIGGDGDDFIDGQQGTDVALMGAGNDTFQWDPGDGSDVVEGQNGTDTMLFNGSAGNEIFDASANGGRLRFTRNLGNIVMDTDDVERIVLNALGGVDSVTVNDLSGTDVADITIDLAISVGGVGGDAQADTVIVNGSAANNTIDISGTGSSLSVAGLAALVTVVNSEGANDALVINALAGDDRITATGLASGIIRLTVDGGTGNDTILGSRGGDVLLGGDDNDYLDGNQGDDTAFMGAGDDTFQWDPGDGNDVIEGQAGFDALRFLGSNVAENIDIFANGGRVIFFRNVANVTMDLNDTERIEFQALGGADNVVVGDLSGTDATEIEIDLRGSNAGGDGAVDTITVNATQGMDNFAASGDANGVQVTGLSAIVRIVQPEAAIDRLILNALGGNDTVDGSALNAGGIQLVINGGLGNDVMIGSAGNDLFNGGDGDDVALMGAGDDVFVWNPGDDDDVLEGQAGRDTMLFNGANVAESFDVAANGGRVRFFRNVAAVLMDLNDVEAIDLKALGGADFVVVNDLSGTDVTEIHVDLGAGGSGDGALDTVILQGTQGDDVAVVAGDASGLSVFGLAAQVNIVGSEVTNDRLVVNGLGGDDAMDASGLQAGAIMLTVDGGADADVVIGSDGDDTLLGGDGDDVLIGGLGIDVLDGGNGDDIEIQ